MDIDKRSPQVLSTYVLSRRLGYFAASGALTLTLSFAAIPLQAQTLQKGKEQQTKKTSPTQRPPETYQPLNPADVSCKMKVGDMWFTTKSDGTPKIASGTITSLTCEDQEIELTSPQLRDGLLETAKYGKIQIGPPNDANTASLSISVLPSQKKELQKLKTAK